MMGMEKLPLSKVKSVILISVLLVLFLSAVSFIHASDTISNISVGTSPEGAVYDSAMGEIFVANMGSNTVSVISDTSYTIVANITVGVGPVCLAYDSAKSEVYVTDVGSSIVNVISDKSNSIVTNVTVGTNPNGIAYDSNKREIFVANWGSDDVSVISDKTNSVVATISVGANPVGVAYDSVKGEIFVTNSYWTRGGNGTVSIISDKNNQVIETISVGRNPFYPAYGSDKGEVLVPNEGNGSISVISDKNNTVISNVVLPGRIENPWALAYDSAKGTIFCTSGNNDMDGTVFVISDSSKDVIANLTQPPVPTGLQVSYSSPFDMYPMYLDKHPSDASITEGYAGAGPHGIVYDPTKGTIFIVNNNAGNVSAVPDDQILPSSPSIVPEFTPETIILIITIISLIFITLVRLKSKIMK